MGIFQWPHSGGHLGFPYKLAFFRTSGVWVSGLCLGQNCKRATSRPPLFWRKCSCGVNAQLLARRHFRGSKNGAFGKPCLCPAKNGVFDENGENDEFVSYPVNKGFAAQTLCNDEILNDENGGCHAGKGMVYQRHGFLFPDVTWRIAARIGFLKSLLFVTCLVKGYNKVRISRLQKHWLSTE